MNNYTNQLWQLLTLIKWMDWEMILSSSIGEKALLTGGYVYFSIYEPDILDSCQPGRASMGVYNYMCPAGSAVQIKLGKGLLTAAESDGELKFLHTVADGPCDDSYGVQVAALAGLPRHVVERSGDLLGFLESQAHGAKAGEKGAPTARSAGQASLLGFVGQPQVRIEKDALGEAVKQALSNIDPDSMSPREAHDALYTLQKILEGEK